MELQVIQNKIYEVRGQKVMLDFDLAELYGSETKRLKEAVRRNLKRFPNDFMFELTKEEFERSLGNMYTMYDNFPISQDIVSDDLNELIERDLYEYAKLKPNSLMKEGTEELLQFFKQKNIKIAVISTHKIKRAIQYLQLTRLYNYVDFIIGGDSNNPPLPDPYLLSIILEQLNVTPEHALVVANYPNLLYAANQKLFNVIYLTDLCPAVNSISYRALKLLKTILRLSIFSSLHDMILWKCTRLY